MILILGKNGAGKSYIANKLLDLGFSRSANYTTREMRIKEVHGIDYFFVSKEQFSKLISLGFFAEYKIRNNNFYGTPKKNLNPKSILVAGDIKQISKESENNPDVIYMDCPLEERFKRVQRRSSTLNDLFERFHEENFLYLNKFEAHFISTVNNDDSALEKVLNIVSEDGIIIDNGSYYNSLDYFNNQLLVDVSSLSSQMLKFLVLEERLLRLISTRFDLNQKKCLKSITKYYYCLLSKELQNVGIQAKRISQLDMNINLDGKDYKSDFKKEKILRR